VTEDPLAGRGLGAGERYHFAFGERTPYSKVISLVERHCTRGEGVVVDLGCGFGAVAEPIRALGLDYLGVDAEPSGVKDLLARSMEALVGDLGQPDQILRELDAAIGGRRLAGILMLDSLEHLADVDGLLRAIASFSLRRGSAPLVVSIPNVTHLDVAVKLLMGRFEMTDTGLLDRTHLRFFSPASLEATMRDSGWYEIDRNDFELSQSDQHFPEELVALVPSTPLGRFLRGLRAAAGQGAFVNQFVRAYLPTGSSGGGLDAPARTSTGSSDRSTGLSEAAGAQASSRSEEAAGAQASSRCEEATEPFLSVLVRTQGRRPHTFAETILSLAAQDCEDFEVLVLFHDVGEARRSELEQVVREHHESFARRVRFVDVCGGGRSRPLNEGAMQARGRYLAVLDDDDVALGGWVGELRRLEERHPGKVLRVGVAEQWVEERPGAWGGEDGYEPVDRPRCPYPMKFDLLEHLYENRTPPSGFAVARSFVVDMGNRWDESLPVLEDWDLLLRAVSLCGVASEEVVGALYRRWRRGESSSTAHAEHEWQSAHAFIVSKLDAQPYLLGPGHLARVRTAVHERTVLEARIRDLESSLEAERRRAGDLAVALDDARGQVDDLRSSTSWRITAPLRDLGRVKRILRWRG
jgi:2-polyprenyl-3-methyl-5-hydroxy-6-metoxy-1,4-benzoquinol methylase